tara:strand:+ start:484 stop:882 length:399 start_codon:yes stop_codon:yes gene_type:complete
VLAPLIEVQKGTAIGCYPEALQATIPVQPMPERTMPSTDPIVHNGIETLSFRQIDQLNQLAKGTTFKLFKADRQELVEECDYFYLPASSYSKQIEALKSTGQIYVTTVNLVLLTRAGYDKLRQRAPKMDSAV